MSDQPERISIAFKYVVCTECGLVYGYPASFMNAFCPGHAVDKYRKSAQALLEANDSLKEKIISLERSNAALRGYIASKRGSP